MNKILSLIVLFISLNSFAQIYKPLFYNENWELTQRKYAEYFRNCYIDTANFTFIGQVKDYYTNGVLEMEGQFDSNGLKQDTFKFYYKNGQIKCYGNYKERSRNAVWSKRQD